MTEAKIILPRPLEHQVPILQADVRLKVCACGRRFGKTICAMIAAITGHGPVMFGEPKFIGVLQGATVWWVARNFPQSRIIWRSLKKATRNGAVSVRESERRIELPGGGSISVKSAEDPDALKGAGIDGAILDECGMVHPDTWAEAVRPMLMDSHGWAFFISTPKGLNWFYELFQQAPPYQQGMVSEWARWQLPTSHNPKILPAEIQAMHDDPNISALTFAQEIEAQFVAPGAGMFRPENHRRYMVLGPGRYSLQDSPEDGGQVRVFTDDDLSLFQTIDLATSLKQTADWTVISTWGVTNHHDLLLLGCRRAKMEGPDLWPAVQREYWQWKPRWVGMDHAGFQLSESQRARREGLPLREIPAKGDKKEKALTAVARHESHKVFFPSGVAWTKDIEMEMWDFPNGDHDDFVDTFSYAAIAVAQPGFFGHLVAPVSVLRTSPWRQG